MIIGSAMGSYDRHIGSVYYLSIDYEEQNSLIYKKKIDTRYLILIIITNINHPLKMTKNSTKLLNMLYLSSNHGKKNAPLNS